MRCGAGERFYSIASLNAGSIVILDGEGTGWSRVTYPAGQPAFIRAEDASLDAGVVTLVKESRLRAASLVHGYSGSWQVLLDQPLAVGTKLNLVEPSKEGEAVVAYKVVAPAAARGYIASASLRKADAADINAFTAKGGVLPVVEGLVIAPPVEALPAEGTTQQAADPAKVETANAAIPAGVDPIPAPRVVTDATPLQTPAPQPAPAIGRGERAQTPDYAATAQSLEPIFQRVYKQPVQTSEIDELVAQYEAVIGTVPADEARLKARLQQRLDLLRVRVDYRGTLERMQQERAQIDQGTIKLNQELEAWSKARVYTIVGQLTASTVYDGDQLPQMYRVVSVGGASPRTLGYIRKSSEHDLDKLLNQVVGIIGETSMDRSLMLNLITPVRIDPLRSDPNAMLLPAPAAPVNADDPNAGTPLSPASPAPAGESPVATPEQQALEQTGDSILGGP
jgi:hypothetical protein